MISSMLDRARYVARRFAWWRPYYKIGKFRIQLTRDHSLPEYQRKFPTYDRFLPKLCRQLPAGSVVVDVGANVGDTIAAIASENPDLRFVAVEPDPAFHKLLVQNAERMRNTVPQLDVEIVHAFIGDNLNVIGSEGGRGTSRAIVSEDLTQALPTPTVRLDEILRNRNIRESSLVKIDTDGFDWSVIDSGFKSISEFGPILFFECDISSDSTHLDKYNNTVRRLSGISYTKFCVFDNFGGLIGIFSSPDNVAQLMRYIEAQNKGLFKRTVYYIDILAVTDENLQYIPLIDNIFSN